MIQITKIVNIFNQNKMVFNKYMLFQNYVSLWCDNKSTILILLRCVRPRTVYVSGSSMRHFKPPVSFRLK